MLVAAAKINRSSIVPGLSRVCYFLPQPLQFITTGALFMLFALQTCTIYSFYRGREEAVHYDRLRRLIVECSYGRESIEAV